jgi:signal transduction histidine kinase/HAMP domain-containing protein
MFLTSVGRRLALIVLTLTVIVMGLLVFIAIDTGADAVRRTTEDNFERQHTILTNAVRQRVQSVSSKGDALADEVQMRSAWTSDELRPYVTDFVGSNGVESEISHVVYYDPANSPEMLVYDYEVAADTPGTLLPTGMTLSPEDIPQDAWVFEVDIDRSGPLWVGPHETVFVHEEDPHDDHELSDLEWGVSYVIPVGDTGLLWIDMPLSVFAETMQAWVDVDEGLDETRDVAGYTLLINNDSDKMVIASIDAPAAATLGLPLGDSVELLATGELVQMDDPLIAGEVAVVLSDIVPGTNWQLITTIPDQVFQRTLPFDAVARLALVTIFGLFFLALAVQQFIRANVTVPLDRLSIAAQEIGAGDMRYQVSYRDREDEIGRLSRALDDMKSNLARSYQELEEWSNTLELRVREGTRKADQLRQDAQANANELRAVYDESLVVVSAYQLQTILQTLTQRIYQLLKASYTAVWLVEDDGEYLRMVANTDPQRKRVGTVIRKDQGIIGRAVTGQSLFVVDDYPNWSGRLDINVSDVMHQAMAVPLLFSGEAIGAVVVGRTYEDVYFEANDQRLLQLFANLVSPAVRNAQLFVQRDDAVREAQRANQVKTRFLASVTHELRTPLNLVINNMDFMRIGAFGEVNDEQRERLDQTIRSAEHLLYLINDLLDVSKIEAGEMQLFVQEADVYTILEDAIANTEVLLEDSKQDAVEFVTEIDEDIPPFPMDARRVRQVLVNLLSNAIKFTEDGSVTLRVVNRKHYIRVDVTDTGMGVPEDELDGLFEAFERTNSAKQKGIEGTGLGLPICKFLVEAHGGEMTVKSKFG